MCSRAALQHRVRASSGGWRQKPTRSAALIRTSDAYRHGPAVDGPLVRRAHIRTTMTLLAPFKSRSAGITAAFAGAAVLAALAVANHVMARRAERRHPPRGSFLEVDGVRLHYSDRGEGSPVVLIHGNAVTGDD